MCSVRLARVHELDRVPGGVAKRSGPPSPRLVVGRLFEGDASSTKALVFGVDVVHSKWSCTCSACPIGWPTWKATHGRPVASASWTNRGVSDDTVRPRKLVYQSRSNAGFSTKTVTTKRTSEMLSRHHASSCGVGSVDWRADLPPRRPRPVSLHNAHQERSARSQLWRSLPRTSLRHRIPSSPDRSRLLISSSRRSIDSVQPCSCSARRSTVANGP